MNDENIIQYVPIGVIKTPFKKTDGMPIQSKFSEAEGTVILPIKFYEATKGLEDFSHVFLIYHFHKAKESKQLVKPFLSNQIMGLFSVRAPNRFNPIGFSVVEVLYIESRKNEIRIQVKGVDMLDQTPLLDIKPYFSEFDCFTNTKNGWYDKREIKQTTADNRFSKQ
ncbi:MAG: tRNA (N6-threonylcarbamoyladenosine(37)-N6)-methyltransferase TrmO [Asgard group archaeon]|nr:tRNA (N6-threonylcarbamoyladenosine(37)-N6)-methyltransferase TrmO [Asgard group archaeon]